MSIDFDDPVFLADPWPVYDWHRRHEPVHFSPSQGSWFVFGHELVRQVMVTPEFTAYHPFRTSRRAFGPTMLDQDGAAHARLRAAAAGPFRPRAVTDYATRIVAPLLAELLDELLAAGRPDFVEVLARRLPMLVVCRVLGLPPDDADRLAALMRPLVDYVDHALVSLADVVAHRERLRSYFADAVARAAGSSLLSTLAAEDLLTGADIVNTSILLLAAGTETTTAGITNLLARVACDENLYRQLRADRSLVPAVVAETLRHEPPLHLTLRFAAREVTVGGVTLPEGAAVQVVLASANRDPDLYPDPDRWDHTRQRRTTSTFGMGKHLCLGIGLATTELELVLTAVLDRMAELSLVDGELTPARGRSFRMVPDVRTRFRLNRPDEVVRS